jgi:two-component system, LuxR family, response regulator FixJ
MNAYKLLTMQDATVFLVDDDPSVRKALTRLITSKGYVVESFSSAKEFLKRDHYEGPACILLDIQMPGLDGLQLQEELTLVGYSIPIIFITGHGTVPISVQAMKGGAVDFLTKPFTANQVLTAINKAIQKNAKTRTILSEIQEIKSRVGSLTPREYDVFRLVVQGLLNKQVAIELGISEKTVKFHRRRAMEKMRADSLAELVLFAQKAGIVKQTSH